MKLKTLIVEIRNGIGIVWLNRPKVNNALDDVMIAELTATMRSLETDPKVRILVLAGKGACFSAGGDLNWMRRMAGLSLKQNQADVLKLATLLQAIDTFKKPTIARVHGPAFAAGLGLVAACDMAIGTYEAEFCLSEVRIGLFPSTVAPYAIRAMGERMARRYFLTAERFTAAEAYRIGLLSDITPPDELDARINELLEKLLQGGPAAQVLCKDWIRFLAHRPITAEVIEESAARIAEARASAEGREGILSFLEKRAPVWLAQAIRTAAKTAATKTTAPVRRPGVKAAPSRNKRPK